MAREQALILAPLAAPRDAEHTLTEIEEMRALVRHELALPLGDVTDTRAALARAAKEGLLEPAELIACAGLIRTASAVRRFLVREAELTPRLANLAARLPTLDGLAARIEASLDPSGEIRDEASDDLARLRQRVRGIQRQLQERLQGMLHDPTHAQYLQDSYISVRNDRYVVPVNASFKNHVPGIVHNASQSGQTLFTEPAELIPLGNDLAIAQSLVTEEERRILTELSGDVGAKGDVLTDALTILGRLDFLRAGASLSDTLRATSPILVDATARLRLRAVRHPLLVLQGGTVVANDVVLEPSHAALVISGPNAGGKTVTLSAVGLCVLMARAGLPVPCDEGSELPLFDVLGTTLGDAQDIRTHHSTFSGHVARLGELLAQARPGALALIDEIAADTDPTEGAAVARAVLEALTDHGSRVLVTTHLDELKALAMTDARFVNARVGLDPVTHAPTYRLQLGVAGLSNALEVARRVGLPDAVIDAARGYLKSGGALSRALDELARHEERLAAAEAALHDERTRVAREREAIASERQSAQAAMREAEQRVREELHAELVEKRREVGVLIAKLQAQPRLEAAQRAQARIEEAVRDTEAQVARLRRTPPRPSGLPIAPGVWVMVESLRQRAQVRAVDGDAAIVSMGSLHTRVPLADLTSLPAGEQQAPSARSRRPTGHRGEIAAEMGAKTLELPQTRCDVRGYRVDEAIKELEALIDRALLDGPSALLVIHGHGTGVLKQAVRDALRVMPQVSSWRAGTDHEGGDGVTLVQLD